MSNDSSVLNKTFEKNEEFSQYKINSPRIDISTLYKKLNKIKNFNFIHDLNNKNNKSNVIKKTLINQNLDVINEKEILNNNKENKSNNNILDKIQKIKIKKIKLPKLKEKYTNEILFKDRMFQNNRILQRNRSSLIYKKDNTNEDDIKNMKKTQNKNCLIRNKNNFIRDRINIFNIKKYSIVNRFLTPNKRPFIIKDLDSDSRDNRFNKQINYNINSYNNNISTSYRSNSKNDNQNPILSRVNSALFITGLNSYHSYNNEFRSFSSKNISDLNSKIKEKIKSKLIINENLRNLLYKLDKKFRPKKKKILSPQHKLPAILNNKEKINKSVSCIHKKEYGDFLVFEKTHLDGIKCDINSSLTAIRNKYVINGGYVDLNVLNYGDNISFQTNLIEKNGICYYEFKKNARMETIEEKIHKVKKDKKEFKKMLERYHQQEISKNLENHDFEVNVKRGYGAPPLINKNIYKDFYHILFKHKKI